MLKSIKHIQRTLTTEELVVQSPLKSECRVVNIGSLDGGGTHWICYWLDDGKAYIFDSFGLPPDDRLVTYLNRSKPNKPNIYYNDSQLQSVSSIKCGYFCVHLLRHLAKGISPYDVIYQFTQHPSEWNENIIMHN